MQQQQLNRIQDQIDRLIVAVGGCPPKRPTCNWLDIGPSHGADNRRAISSAPASLAITSGHERDGFDSRLFDYDEDCVMSEEVAKLVRKYSTKLRE